MRGERYEGKRGGKSLKKIGRRLLTAVLAAALGLSCQVLGAQTQEAAKQRLQEVMQQLQDTVKRRTYESLGQQGQAEVNQQLQGEVKQETRQTQGAEDYTDAIMFSPVMNLETNELDNSWGLSCSAVSYGGYTYVFTAGDYEDFDYDKYLRMTGDLDSNAEIIMAPLGNGLAVCYGSSPLEGQPAAPLGEIDPEARLAAGFYAYNQKEDQYTMINGWIAGSLEQTEGGYILDEDLGVEGMWNGALVVDSQTGEAVGIGGYRDGQYLVYDIPIDVVEELFALENWGEYTGEDTPEEGSGETDAQPGEAAADEPKEAEPETAAKEEPEEEETEEKETEAPAKAEPKERDGGSGGEEPVEQDEPDPEDTKTSERTGSLPPSAWIAILTGILVVIFLAGNRKKKGASPGRPEENDSTDSEKSEYTPPSGTIQLGLEQRQSQYILDCVSGPTAGQQIVIYDNFRIGRDPQNSDLTLPEDTKGVSRRHCRIEIRDGRILLRDLDSSYGTFLENGVKLEAQTPYSIDPGMVFYVGSHQVAFRVIKR